MARDVLLAAGELSLWVSVLMVGWSLVVSGAGAAMQHDELVRSGRRALVATAVALSLSVAGLLSALFTHDFSFAYVAQYTTAGLAPWHDVAAAWDGVGGALLVATWMAAMLAALRVATGSGRAPREVAAAAVVILVAVLLVAIFANPYHRVGGMPVNGAGPTPWMRHPEVAAGRLVELAGYAAAAMAVAMVPGAGRAAATGGPVRGELHAWIMAAWTLLSAALGLLLHAAFVYTGTVGAWYASPEIVGASLVWLGAATALHATGPVGGAAGSRVGEHVAHAGAVLAGLAFVANMFTTSTSVQLAPGKPVAVSVRGGGSWRFTSQGLSQFAQQDHGVSALSVEAARAGGASRLLVARQLMFGTPADTGATQPESQPAIVAGATGALRVVLLAAGTDAADARVSFVPLVWLLWVGSLLCVVGGVATLAFAASVRGRRP